MSYKPAYIFVTVGCCAALLSATPARADIFDDILNSAQLATTRATQARDRATEARDRATESRDRAIEARNSANEIRDNVRTAILSLTTEMHSAITDAVDDLSRILEQEIAGRDAFLSGGCAACGPFRMQLTGFLQNIETLLNSPFLFSGLQIAPVDLQRARDIINAVPDRALYPLYRALAVESELFSPELLAQIQDLATKIALLDEAMAEIRAVAGTPRGTAESLYGQDLLDEKFAGCTTTLTKRFEYREAALTATLVGIELRAFGQLYRALGETGFDQDCGLHGYVHVNIKDNPLKKLGTLLDGVGQVLLSVGGAVNGSVDQCEDFAIRQLLRDETTLAHADILDGQKAILQAISNISAAATPDLDHDQDVDLADFALFQVAFSGPLAPRPNIVRTALAP